MIGDLDLDSEGCTWFICHC